MFESLRKIQIVFRLIQKKDDLLYKINTEESQETPNLDKLEQLIALFCLHSSRLFVQVS
jgi:hypothetical protein